MSNVIARGLSSVLYGWRQSLSFFSFNEFTTILLAGLNTWLRAATLLALFFGWWLLPLAGYFDTRVLGSGIFGSHWLYFAQLPSVEFGFFAVAQIITTMVISMFIILAVRPSHETKDLYYFYEFMGRMLYIAPFFMIVPHITTFPVYWLTIFFFLDTNFSLPAFKRSVWNAFVFALHYFPFLFVLGILPHLAHSAQQALWEYTPLTEGLFWMFVLRYVLSIFVHAIFVALLVTLYVKVKHSNNSLFAYNTGFDQARRRRGVRMSKTRNRNGDQQKQKGRPHQFSRNGKTGMSKTRKRTPQKPQK